MNRIRQFFSTTDPNGQTNSDPLFQGQYKILQTALLLASLFGLVLSLLSVGQTRLNGDLFFTIISLAFTVFAILLFVFRTLSINTRVVASLSLAFVFANLVFVHSGWSGLAILLLVNFVLVSSALLEKKGALVALSLAGLVLIVWAVFVYTQQIESLHPVTNQALLIEVVLVLLTGILVSLVVDSARNRARQRIDHFADTQTQVSELEEKLAIENKEIENSLARLKSTNEIIQIAASTTDPHQLIKKTADLLQQRFDLNYVGIFLIDQSAEYAVLHYGTGEAGRRMLTSSYRLAVAGYSLVGKAIQSRQMKMTYENDPSSVSFENPFLPESHSELAIPLSRDGEVFGALNIHSVSPDGFNENDSLVFRDAADLLSLSLGKNTGSNAAAIEKMRSTPKFSSTTFQTDNREIEFSFENPLVTKTSLETSKVQVPLMLRDELIGAIDLEIEGRQLTQGQTEFLETISAQTAVALENASLLEQTLQRAERERKVLEITSRIRSTNDSQQMLQIALEELSKNLGVSKAQIVLNVPEKPLTETPSETNTMTLTRKRTTGELREP